MSGETSSRECCVFGRAAVPRPAVALTLRGAVSLQRNSPVVGRLPLSMEAATTSQLERHAPHQQLV